MYGRMAELSLELEHRHSDGSWGTFERAHHDAADHDPEREWLTGQVYSCTTCDELVRIKRPNEEPDPGVETGG